MNEYETNLQKEIKIYRGNRATLDQLRGLAASIGDQGCVAEAPMSDPQRYHHSESVMHKKAHLESVRRTLCVTMRVLRQFGVLVLLLVTCMTPAMACTIPDAQMSPQERACCHTMKNQCGQMKMTASHGCCQKTPPSIHDNALVTKTVAFHPAALAVIWLTASELLNPNSAVTGWVEHADYSPPKSPPFTVSILRI